MQLAGLYLYPVKSLPGCAVAAAEIDPFGLVGDRRFPIVDVDGHFLTQRTLADYRRDARDPAVVNFGINLIHELKSGTLELGDPVIAS